MDGLHLHYGLFFGKLFYPAFLVQVYLSAGGRRQYFQIRRYFSGYIAGIMGPGNAGTGFVLGTYSDNRVSCGVCVRDRLYEIQDISPDKRTAEPGPVQRLRNLFQTVSVFDSCA